VGRLHVFSTVIVTVELSEYAPEPPLIEHEPCPGGSPSGCRAPLQIASEVRVCPPQAFPREAQLLIVPRLTQVPVQPPVAHSREAVHASPEPYRQVTPTETRA